MAVLCSYIRTAWRQSIRCCIVLKYLAQRVPSACGSITWHTFHCLILFSHVRLKWTSWSYGRGSEVGNIISHLYKCVILFIVVSCNCHTTSIWHCKQTVNTTWLTYIIRVIYTNVWICQYLFIDWRDIIKDTDSPPKKRHNVVELWKQHLRFIGSYSL